MSRSSCFDCGSSDGLAIYSDGTYCFSCQKQTKSKSLFEEGKPGIDEHKAKLQLPVDIGEELPPKAIEWLLQFLNVDEINRFAFWSSKYHRICFPYYILPAGKQHSDMLMCWMRTLNSNTKMKWLFTGDNTVLPFYIPTISQPSGSRICLVEDVISGIKVSKFLDVIVLGTTDIGRDSPILTKLEQYDKVILFLDGDNAGKKGTERLRNDLKLLYNVKIIRNSRDPKNYSNDELQELLNGS